MALITPSQINTSQPQQVVGINWANPLARGLVYASPGHEYHNAVDGKAPTSITGTRVRGAPSGRVRGFNSTLGAGTTDVVSANFSSTSSLRTYLVRAMRNGAGGGSLGRIFNKESAELLYWISPGITYSRFRSTTTGEWRANSSLSLGVPQVLCISYDDSSTGNTPAMYVDGSPVTATRLSGVPSGSVITNGNAYLIGNSAAGNRSWDGWIGEFFAWDRILSPAEIAEVSRNPWQLFAPIERSIWVPVRSSSISQFDSNYDRIFNRPTPVITPQAPEVYKIEDSKAIIRNSQPQQLIEIDWKNPLSRGLVDAILPGRLRSVRGVAAAVAGTDGSVMGSSQGLARSFAGGNINTRDTYTGTWSRLSNQFTLLAVYQLRAIPGVNPVRITGNWITSNNGFLISPNNSNFRGVFASGSGNVILTGGAPSTAPKVDILTYNGTSGRFFENGVLTVGPTAGAYSAPTGDFFVGTDPGATGETPNGTIALTILWNRALESAEIQEISRNPWQIFQPQKQQVWPSRRNTNYDNIFPSEDSYRIAVPKPQAPRVVAPKVRDLQRNSPPQQSVVVNPYWKQRGLKSLWLFQRRLQIRGRSYINYVEENQSTNPIQLGGYTPTYDSLGRKTTPGTGDVGWKVPHYLDTTRPISIVVGASKSSGSVVWSILNTAANWTGWYSGNGGTVSSVVSNSFDGVAHPGGSTIAFSHSGSTLIGVNEVGQSVIDTSAPFPSPSNQFITFGYSDRGAVNSDNPAAAAVTHLATFQGALTKEELVSLAVNPWQLFQPQDRNIWIPGSSFPSRYSGSPGATVKQSKPLLAYSDRPAPKAAPFIRTSKSIIVRQPQQAIGVNWANPLTKDIGWLTTGISCDNFATRGRSVARFDVKNSSQEGSLVGQAAKFNGTGSDYFSTGFGATGASHPYLIGGSFDYTLMAYVIPTSLPGAITYASGTCYYISTDNIVCNIGTDGSNRWRFSQRYNGITSITTGSNIVLGKPIILVATSDGSLYESGGILNSTFVPTIYRARAIDWMTIARGGLTDTGFFNGFVIAEAGWSRVLLPQEALSIISNPWQLFQPSNSNIWVPTNSGTRAFVTNLTGGRN